MSIQNLIERFKAARPDLSEESLISFMLKHGLLPKGYCIERGFRDKVPAGRPTGTARIVDKWIVYNDGKAEFSEDTEQKAIDYVAKCKRLNETGR